MKLQIFKYFIHVADEGSYTKAAEKCFVSQPALSKAISEFESELNCTLFKRNGRKLELTESGELVYKEVKKILKLVDDLKAKVIENNEIEEEIKVGYIIIGHLQYFQKVVKSLHNAELDKAHFTTIYDSAYLLKERLMNDEIDLAILPNSCEKNLPKTKVHYFPKRHLYILVHKSHPLYKKDEVNFEELRYVSIVGWDTEDLPDLAKSYDKEFINHGIQPNIIARGKKMGDVISLMQQYNAISLSGPITTTLSSEEYKLIPIVDSEKRFGLCLVWKKENNNSLLRKIISQI